jgi:hypothetical protein
MNKYVPVYSLQRVISQTRQRSALLLLEYERLLNQKRDAKNKFVAMEIVKDERPGKPGTSFDYRWNKERFETEHIANGRSG